MSDYQKESVRIDKWLWAARFFKTRNLAKQAIDGGKVQCDGQKVKPSKEISVGTIITLPRGWDKIEVEVKALSDQRRGAPEAQKLYSETESSITKREEEAALRKASGASYLLRDKKPDKKERRQLDKWRQQDYDD